MNLKELRREMPYKWRVQSFSKHKPQASCVAYVDARDVMDMLDEVCGPENWQQQFREINGMLFCGISIKVDGEWVTKWDTGSESNIEKDKGHVSDSFKRAAVHWGPGRFLYSLPIKYVPANEAKNNSNYPYVVDGNGKRVWDLTKHINGMNGKQPSAPTPDIQAPAPTANFDKFIKLQDERRKLAQDHPKKGTELVAQLELFGFLDPKDAELIKKDKRTTAEQRQLIVGYIAYVVNESDIGAKVRLLHALSTYKHDDGTYGHIEDFPTLLTMDVKKHKKQINMLYSAAKGAAIFAALRAEEKQLKAS